MYKYLIAFVLLTPLIGIHMVEGGEYAASVGVDGYKNGATIAFAIYAAVVAVIGWLTSGRGGDLQSTELTSMVPDEEVRGFCGKFLIINLVFLLVFLFAFDAVKVWTGGVGKGEFRTGLGAFGAVPNLMTKFILPALLAYIASMYRRSPRTIGTTVLVVANFVLLFVIGASWGFKSTAFMVLTPALLVLYWRLSFFASLRLAAIFLVGLVVFFQLFDADVEVYADVQSFLLRRITILQGDVSWYVWDLYTVKENFPNYWPTLLAALGNTTLSWFGITHDDFYNWTMYHYDLMVTYVAGVSLEQIEGGHSITGTPFSEGVIAAGITGVACFAVIAGLLVGRMYHFINKSLVAGDDAAAAIGSTYFCFYVFAWLNGGAIVQLFHVSILVALLFTCLLIVALQSRKFSWRPENLAT